MAEYLSPGVYVEEFESGSRPMAGVSTSVVGFLGLTMRGPVSGNPQLVTNSADFKRKYGSYLSESEFGNFRFLAYAVDQFFLNGGSNCFVMRVCPEDAKEASSAPVDGEANQCLTFTSKNPGLWGNDIKIKLNSVSKAKTQVFEVSEETNGTINYHVKSSAGFNTGDIVVYMKENEPVEDTPKTYSKIYNIVTKSSDNTIQFLKPFDNEIIDKELLPKRFIQTCEFILDAFYEDVTEHYEDVSLNIDSANYIEKKLSKSDLVSVSVNTAYLNDSLEKEINHPLYIIANNSDNDSALISLSGGSNGTMDNISDENFMTTDFIGKDGGPGKRSGLQAFIDNDIVSIMAIPGVTNVNIQLNLVAQCENLASRFAILDIPRENKSIDDVLKHREILDSNYAAMYHPWLYAYDSLNKKNSIMPPSGLIAGVFSRSDQERGVHKAPANEVIKGVTGFDCVYNKGEQDILNPKGVNLIRSFPGQGIRVWGARTCSSNSLWKYINVRRLFIYVEESIKANTNWIVFEPNDELLWIRVRRTIETFLDTVWRNGALFGSSPSDAYFIDIGHTTMSQDDIDNGRLICVIGIAPVKPAEFVIFRLTQKTREE